MNEPVICWDGECGEGLPICCFDCERKYDCGDVCDNEKCRFGDEERM